MTNAVRFGSIETITTQGNTTMTVTENIHDYTPTSQCRKTTIKIIAENRKKVLAEILKLADKLNDDNVDEIAFECAKRKNGQPFKMSVSWVSK